MICIVGYGYVGQATHKLIGSKKVDLIIDVNSTESDWGSASDADVVFICVPTPMAKDGSCDTSLVSGAMKRIGQKPLYAIRSTVPWTFAMPGYNVVANPEFINQNDYLSDNSKAQLLGGIYQDTSKVEALYSANGIKCITTPWSVAWQVKYCSNLYGAFKVSFWEMIQDITGDERYIYNTWKQLGFNQGDLAQVGMDGFRGFGGACFPKDVCAMKQLTKHPLIDAILKYNASLQDGTKN